MIYASTLNPSTPGSLLNSAVDPFLYNTKCLLGAIMKIHGMTRIRHYMLSWMQRGGNYDMNQGYSEIHG